ncbi:alpha/beta hydrolase-fold protein [Bacillus velezensis]|uniref:alpha/beta hydrolase-fold protein n=1 Tax=Bacillus velezensis TaxID=492670 RepID=UPI003CE6E976
MRARSFYIDKEYPTYQVGYGRTMIGDSLGGTVSLMTAIDYPNMFGNVIMQSPYVDGHVLDAVRQSEDLKQISVIIKSEKKKPAFTRRDGQVLDFTGRRTKSSNSCWKANSLNTRMKPSTGIINGTYWQPLITPALKKML